jgi:hypothetical protein
MAIISLPISGVKNPTHVESSVLRVCLKIIASYRRYMQAPSMLG